MDDFEDESRYPPKLNALNRYRTSHQQRHPISNVRYPCLINSSYVEDEDGDEELDVYDIENNDEEDDVGEDGDGENGYGQNFQGNDNFERLRKKRKLRNSLLPTYELPSHVKFPYGSRSSSEEWSEHATFVLLEVWGDKFIKLGRKSLRSEDWHDVAERVSVELKVEKTEFQCRNMLNKLKIRYKKEKAKEVEMGMKSSKWAFSKKMDMLMAPLSKQEYGLPCGMDSGEYVFMNTGVYLDRSNGFDEMQDSPGESETSVWGSDSDELLPRGRGVGEDDDEGSSFSVLADSIQKFGKICENIEISKRQQMEELEKMRLGFHKDLESQKKRILEKAQAEIAKIQEADDDETDSSAENLSD